MRKIKLTRNEKSVENALLSGEYVNVPHEEFGKVADAIKLRRKDAVLNIRINSLDLKLIKEKAERLGVRYQSFVSEILHKLAHSPH
jgi:predicted DNA binding CopG/RHH family protein